MAEDIEKETGDETVEDAGPEEDQTEDDEEEDEEDDDDEEEDDDDEEEDDEDDDDDDDSSSGGEDDDDDDVEDDSDLSKGEQMTQDGAPLTIDHPFDDGTDEGRDMLLMRNLKVREKLDDLFSIEAHVVSKRTNLEFEDIVGQTVGFRIEQDDEDRYFHGVVTNFMQYATSDPELDQVTWYELKVRPKLWLLTLSKDCRVYQNQSPLDIIKGILEEFEITDFDFKAEGGQEPREYVVQYNETYFTLSPD